MVVLGLASAKEAFLEAVAEYAERRHLAEQPYVFSGTSNGADLFDSKNISL